MGFLVNDGNTLSFNDSKKYISKIKQDGVTQLINLLKKYENWDLRKDVHKYQAVEPFDPIYWGDEIEAHVIQLDHENKKARINADLDDLYDSINQIDPKELSFKMVPEYGAWMIETTPKDPYFTVNNLDPILVNLEDRKRVISKHLKKDQHVLLTSSFQLLGQPDHDYFLSSKKGNTKEEGSDFQNQITNSLFIDDRIINNHPRFPTLTQNIRQRRGSKVCTKVPLFIDKLTQTIPTEIDPYPGFIYMDAMAFGMGSTCVQTTFSAKNLNHARWLYDQLSILTPLALALTASSPIFRGKLAAIDTRWDIIQDCVDCRTEEERDPTSENYIPKSRYSSISFYTSNDIRNKKEYSDLKFPLNKTAMEQFIKEAQENEIKIDDNLTRHVGFLFLRDPLVLFEQKINIDNTKETSHFESFQSTNWNSVRLKPPPSLINNEIGWRVEFRTMESQITTHDNTAFILFSQILVRMFFSSEKLNLYIPISSMDENFKRARQINAVVDQKFLFRVNVFDDGLPQIEELTLHEIFFGKENVFQGLHKISDEIWSEMMAKLYGQNQKKVFDQVWEFIKEKTTGKRVSIATWVRKFVQKHPAYKQDSIITNEIGFDLIKSITSISEGTLIDSNFSNVF